MAAGGAGDKYYGTSNNDDEIRTQFSTREGVYRVVSGSGAPGAPPDYSRPGCPSRYPSQLNGVGNVPVKLSFVNIPASPISHSTNSPWHPSSNGARPPGYTGSWDENSPEGSLGRGPNSVYDEENNSVKTDRLGIKEYNEHSRSPSMQSSSSRDVDEVVGFNIGKELYVCNFSGASQPTYVSRPIEKKIYRSVFPTCHDFNQFTASSERLVMLVGFNQGQIQLLDVVSKERNKLFNEDLQIDNSRVTCVRWVPGSASQFLVAHSSGHIYVYDETLTPVSTAPTNLVGVATGTTGGNSASSSGNTAPVYQVFKQGAGFSVHTCKSVGGGGGKGAAAPRRNPLYRWTVEAGCKGVCDVVFSPCSRYLAIVTQDGYLHVFNYDHQELVGSMRSYFGGLRCAAWSPDGRYIVTGGEDDLITVWSLAEKRVVCRGRGHRSWVTSLAFDMLTCQLDSSCKGQDMKGKPLNGPLNRSEPVSTSYTSYRVGSVGEDATLCLWELTEDVLKCHLCVTSTTSSRHRAMSASIRSSPPPAAVANGDDPSSRLLTSSSESSGLAARFTATLSLGDQSKTSKESTSTWTKKLANSVSPSGKDSKSKSTAKVGIAASNSPSTANGDKTTQKTTANAISGGGNSEEKKGVVRHLGTPACPRINEVMMIEALTCKRISNDRLTAVAFRRDCFLTASQEGVVLTWARPESSTSQCNTNSVMRGKGGGGLQVGEDGYLGREGERL